MKYRLSRPRIQVKSLVPLTFNMNSQEYWNERWKKTPSKYEASWKGDPHMRILELVQIKNALDTVVATPKIIELGCGAFTLDEYAPLAKVLATSCYWGLDTSEVAIYMAQVSHPEHAFDTRCASEFLKLDCGFNFLICRRVLQNMDKETRAKTIPLLASVPHGILLECTQPGLDCLNAERSEQNLGGIGAPQFNDYLSSEDIQAIGDTIHAYPTYPFSHYYLKTRAVPYRTQAGDIVGFMEQVLGGRFDTPSMGPHTVWSW